MYTHVILFSFHHFFFFNFVFFCLRLFFLFYQLSFSPYFLKLLISGPHQQTMPPKAPEANDLSKAAGGLKKVQTQEKNPLPTKE